MERTWSEEGGRRTYELTTAGRRRLNGDRAAWRGFASAVTAILEPSR